MADVHQNDIVHSALEFAFVENGSVERTSAATIPVQASHSVITQSVEKGRLLLPGGCVIHMIPQKSQREVESVFRTIMSPVVMAFALGALMQARTRRRRGAKRRMSEPFRLLATKVMQAEWTQRQHTLSNEEYDMLEHSSKSKKKKQRKPRRDENFTGDCFFNTIFQ